MPGYKGHLVGGTVVFLIVLYAVQTYCTSAHTALQWFICTLAGALFPDIDVKSKGQKYFYWIVFVLLLGLFAIQQFELLALCGIASITPMLCKHRGIFHEPWFVVGLPSISVLAASIAYPNYSNTFFFYGLFFVTGALSHLYLDRGFRGIIPRRKFKKF